MDRSKRSAQEAGRRGRVILTSDPLLRAFYENNVERMGAIIREDPAELERLLDQVHPLACLAAKEDRDDVLGLVNSLGGRLDLRNAEQMTPLHLAVMHGCMKATNFLTYLKSSDLNEPYPNGDYLLHRACVTGQPELVLQLMRVGADPNKTNAQGLLPLHKACEEESVAMAAALLPKTENVNVAGQQGRTALHIAAANQSLALIKLLLAYNADIDKYDRNKESPMDIIIQMGNKNILVGLANFLDRSVTGSFLSFKELDDNAEFSSVLRFIEAIDNEITHPTAAKKLEVPEEEASRIIGRIATEEKTDFMEFRSMLKTIAYGGLSQRIIDHKIVDKLAVAVCKQVLFREDAEMLRLIVYNTGLWPAIRSALEEDVFILYETCQEIGSTGMVGLIKHETFDTEDEMNIEDFCRFVAQVSNLPALDMSREKERDEFLKDPLQSLTLWSILTGRFDLTEDLLKTEQFDIIPMGLMCAGILRNIRFRPEIPSPTKKIMENVADKCESVAVKLLRSITEYDTSDNKVVSIQYMRCPLHPYSNKSAIDLAASGQSESFITMPSVQSALDMEWYDRLYKLPWLLRQFLVLMALIPYNPIVAFILIRLEKKKAEERRSKAATEEEEEDKEVIGVTLGSEARKRNTKDKKDEDRVGATDRRKKMRRHLTMQQSEEALTDDKPDQQQADMELARMDSRSTLLSTDRKSRGRPGRSDEEPTKAENIFKQSFDAMNKLYNTPCVKFRFHVMSHIIFVLIFSIVMVAQFRYHPTPLEIIVYLFLCGFLLEELREANMALNSGTMSEYISDGWNIIDNTAILLGLAGFVLRLFRINTKMTTSDLYTFTDSFWWCAHLTLALSCLLFWIRLLYISTVLESLGPKLKMIYIMIIRDFLPFLIILSIVMFGFGIAIHGLLFPNGYAKDNKVPLSGAEIFQRMFKITFYAMVGDYSLDLIQGSDCNNETTTKPCPHPLGKIVVLNMIMVIYIVITSVLLLNLIISLFSKTVEEVDSKSFALWQFERYNLVHEFHIRFPLPPPLNILGSVFKRISGIFLRFKARGRQDSQKLTRGFEKASVFHFLLYQAFSLRRKRKYLEGDVEIEDIDKIIGEINTNVKLMNTEIGNLTRKVAEQRDECEEDED
ncbi:hypothetical protein BOX15_Mlig012389g1 [Macrostomum lignano]|uniref:ANK_REP_REGION domain-containing protein n=2 Tax=Macrostomum lignano TaxID=282301 RepID=A0A1I8GV72_9PLAT|nr:hypothetical protein BOX15_Mlig012389g1 [Macrostomum lignano]